MDWENVKADEELILSNHFTQGRGGFGIEFIVIHHMAGNLSLQGCYNVWQTREASAHYGVDENGRVGQFVWDSDTAWHASDYTANCKSLGIEHADKLVNGVWTFADATIDAGAHLVAALCKYYQLGEPQWLVNVYPHNHFAATACPATLGNTLNERYMTLARKYYAEMTGSNNIEAVDFGVYRLCNQYTGFHLFTNSYDEANNLAKNGWTYEGVGFSCASTGTEVFRLYNQNNGDHLLTTSRDEVVSALLLGWTWEGRAFHRDKSQGVRRLYNPFSGEHFYTNSSDEAKTCIANGWNDEGKLV